MHKYLIASLTILCFHFFSLAQEIEDPIISHQSGFYTDNFEVVISHTDPTVLILYTLDGSEPKLENIEGEEWEYKKTYQTRQDHNFGEMVKDTIFTYEYSSPLLIEDRSSYPDKYADIATSHYINDSTFSVLEFENHHVFKGTNLRVVAYKDGEYSNVLTYNYFISPEGKNRYSLPIVCISIPPNGFYGYEEGINVPGKAFDDWRLENPSINVDDSDWDNNINAPGNHREKGEETEQAIHLMYFNKGKVVLNQNGGLRIAGNQSRFLANRPLRIYAKSKYGAKNMNYGFFKDYPKDKFKRLIMRNAGQDTQVAMMRDYFVHQVSKKLNVEIQEGQPIILFINGEYHGFYYLRERYDKKHFNIKYDIPEDELDYMKNSHAKEGTTQDYENVIDFVNNHTFETQENISELDKRVDILNIIDYFIVGTFMNNVDWPGNNRECFRKRTTDHQNPIPMHDGRWRWMLKDYDYSLGEGWRHTEVDYQKLREVVEGDKISTVIFRKALESDSVKDYFINRYCDVLNSTYSFQHLSSTFNNINTEISPEIQEFAERWNPVGNVFYYFGGIIRSKDFFAEKANLLYDYTIARTDYLFQELKEVYNLQQLNEIEVDVDYEDRGYLTINSIDITSKLDGINSAVYPWSGRYFEDIPITIKAKAKKGYQFSHWSGMNESKDSVITLSLNENFYLKAHFVSSKIFNSLEENDVEIFPNPAYHTLHIVSKNPQNFVIIDAIGREIQHSSIQLTETEMDISHLKQGVYFLLFENGAKKQFIKS